MDGVINLVKTGLNADEYGIERKQRTAREVFCRVESITRSEFGVTGGRSGLNPELVFTIFAGDYEDEIEIEYNGKSYAVYRTYRTDSDYLELYAERKGGTNGTIGQT